MSKDGSMFSLHEDDYGMGCDYWCQDDVCGWLDASGLPSGSHSPSSITMDIRTRGRENRQQFLLNPQIDHRRWRRNNNRWWRNIYPCMIIFIIINTLLTRGLKCLHSSHSPSRSVRSTAIVCKIEIISMLCVEEERESICWDWVCWCLESGWCAKWQCPGHLASVRGQLGGDSPPHHGVMPFYRSLLTKYFSGQ